jgi:dynein heavy chain, axonemal
VAGIRTEVEKLEKTLLLQRSWMYLESIFGAPDIQRQLPGPAKAFQAIDKEFRAIMRSVKQKPMALAVRPSSQSCY